MEMGDEKLSVWARAQGCFMSSTVKLVDIGKKMKKLARDDPRIMVHSLKAALALTLVSILFYVQPTYDRLRFSTMWAVMTVIVVFEFSVGATLGKVINTGFATLVAVVLGIGVNHLARLSGHTGEPVLLALIVFFQAVPATFLRFWPEIKARYDYGLLIFILTFAMMSVSGFRDVNILDQAHGRLTNIAIGCCTCVVVSLVVCPVWAGHDLHDHIANNIQTLATFLEGFGSQISGGVSKAEGYDSVLKSEAIEESLANFARWEPGHGRFRFGHPWEQYLKIGALIRQCAHKIEALNSYLISSNVYTPPAIICREIHEACIEMSLESGRALNELATALKTMTQPQRAVPGRVPNSDTAAMKLVSLLHSSGGQCGDGDRLGVVSVATVGLMLTDVVRCTDRIADSVRELASHAGFEPTATNGVEPVESSSEMKSRRFENDAVQCVDNEAAKCSCVITVTHGD